MAIKLNDLNKDIYDSSRRAEKELANQYSLSGLHLIGCNSEEAYNNLTSALFDAGFRTNTMFLSDAYETLADALMAISQKKQKFPLALSFSLETFPQVTTNPILLSALVKQANEVLFRNDEALIIPFLPTNPAVEKQILSNAASYTVLYPSPGAMFNTPDDVKIFSFNFLPSVYWLTSPWQITPDEPEEPRIINADTSALLCIRDRQ